MDKDKTEGIDPKLLEIAEVESDKVESKKELKKFNYIFYQYTIRNGSEPVIIIYSKNLPKEFSNPQGKSITIKDVFVESVISQDFLGFKITASYKEKINDYNLLIEYDKNWMIVTELVKLDDWVTLTKKDIPAILQNKKDELIFNLDQMQKDGKIQIKKK